MPDTHECHPRVGCSCSSVGLEPDDDCPMHGHPWPPRCEVCGRFMPWPDFYEETDHA